MLRRSWLIAKTVLIEAIRRKEIYAIVLISVLIIGAVMTVDFFNLRGLTKFYAEVALKVMSSATALTVVVLAVRQLPREFETRTIYPLLAKPVGRGTFLVGKAAGVLLAAAFCLALFMAVYVVGSIYLGSHLHWALLTQFIYLQLVGFLILIFLGEWLSLVVNTDAAMTLGAVIYFASDVMSSATTYIYHLPETTRLVRGILTSMTWLVPQMFLFDLTEKTVHGDAWQPLSMKVLAMLTVYALVFSLIFGAFTMFCFRRKPL